jgi:inositol-1,3,4-trisphosphate 5/6-kinase/inositol-tetrakisphosphate 1-kinase
MHIVFNAETLPSLPAPYVAQQFINHDAVLFKVFAIGGDFAVVARPSIRNLAAATSRDIISFHSHDVSKATSTSFLNEVSSEEDAELGSGPGHCLAGHSSPVPTLTSLLGWRARQCQDGH